VYALEIANTMFIMGRILITIKLINNFQLYLLLLEFILFLFTNTLIKSNVKDKQLNFIDIRYRYNI